MDVKYLISITNGSKAHLLNKWLLNLVSESLEIPLVTVGKEMPEIRRALRKLEADTIVSGVMTTPEHMNWYHEICNPIQVKHYAPLWGKKPLTALTEMKQLGFQILVIEVDVSMGSREDWLGREIDNDILREIKELERDQKMNPIGELGEYHTLVLDCPIYKKMINILESEIVWENSKGYLIIKKANLQSRTKYRN